MDATRSWSEDVIGFDTRDDATQIAKYTERRIPALDAKVNRQKRQLGKSDADLITISALRGAVVCLIQGISGVQNQTDGVEVDDAKMELIREASVLWFTEVTQVLDGALDPERRADTFASAPSVWSALGALGHEVLNELGGAEAGPSNEAMKAAFTHAANRYLVGIDWERNDKWLDVGAKRSSSGVITLGGPKETGSLVFKGLKEGTLKGAPTAATSTLPDLV